MPARDSAPTTPKARRRAIRAHYRSRGVKPPTRQDFQQSPSTARVASRRTVQTPAGPRVIPTSTYKAPKVKPITPTFKSRKSEPISGDRPSAKVTPGARKRFQQLKYDSPERFKTDPEAARIARSTPVRKISRKAEVKLRKEAHAKLSQIRADIPKRAFKQIKGQVDAEIIRRTYKIKKGRVQLETPRQKRNRKAGRPRSWHAPPRQQRKIPTLRREVYGLNKQIEQAETRLAKNPVQSMLAPGPLSTRAARQAPSLHRKIAKLTEQRSQKEVKLSKALDKRAKRQGTGAYEDDDPSTLEALSIASLGIPGVGVGANVIGRGGWAAVRAATGAVGKEAVLGVAGREVGKAAGRAAARLAGERGSIQLGKAAAAAGQNPTIKFFGQRFLDKPIRSAAWVAGIGGPTYGLGKDLPESLRDIKTAVRQFSEDPENTLADIAKGIEVTPEVIYHSLKGLVEKGEVRRQTIKAAPAFAFYAVAFPFLAGYESVHRGTTGAVGKFATDIHREISHFYSPAMERDWQKFNQRLGEAGRGGVLTPLTTAVPLASLVSRGMILGAKAGLKTSGRADLAAKLNPDRPDFKYGPGPGQVRGRRGSKGLARLPQLAADEIARVVGERRVARDPNMRGKPGEGEVLPIFPKLHWREQSKRAVQDVARGEISAIDRHQRYDVPREKMLRKYNDDPLFGYAVTYGPPENARAAINLLEGHRETIRRNPSSRTQQELPVIERLISQLERQGDKRIPKELEADAYRYDELTRAMGDETTWLSPEQQRIRALMTQAEHLLTMQDREAGYFTLEDIKTQAARRGDNATEVERLNYWLDQKRRGGSPAEALLAPEQPASRRRAPGPKDPKLAREQTAAEFAGELVGQRQVKAVPTGPRDITASLPPETQAMAKQSAAAERKYLATAPRPPRPEAKVVQRRREQLAWAEGQYRHAAYEEGRLAARRPKRRTERRDADLTELEVREDALSEAQAKLAEAHRRYDKKQEAVDEAGANVPVTSRPTGKAAAKIERLSKRAARDLRNAEARLKRAKKDGDPEAIVLAEERVAKLEERVATRGRASRGEAEPTSVRGVLSDRLRKAESQRAKAWESVQIRQAQVERARAALDELREGGVTSSRPLAPDETAKWDAVQQAAEARRKQAETTRNFLRDRVQALNRESIRLRKERLAVPSKPAKPGPPKLTPDEMALRGAEARLALERAASAQRTAGAKERGVPYQQTRVDQRAIAEAEGTVRALEQRTGIERRQQDVPVAVERRVAPDRRAAIPEERGLPRMEKVLGPTKANQAARARNEARGNLNRIIKEKKAAASGLEQAKMTLAGLRREAKHIKPRQRKAHQAKIEQAKRTRDDLKTRLDKARRERQTAVTALNVAKKALKRALIEAKGRRDPYHRNYHDDMGTYVKAVPGEKIAAAARERGLGAPGYWTAQVDDLAGYSGPMAKGSSVINPQQFHGDLFRKGLADMNPMSQMHVMRRLNNTIHKSRSLYKATYDLAEPLQSVLPNAPTNLTAGQTIRYLHDHGVPVENIALWNEKSANRLQQVVEGKRTAQTEAEVKLMETLRKDDLKPSDAELAIEAAWQKVVEDSMVRTSKTGRGWDAKTPLSDEAAAQTGWRVGDARAQIGFQARLNPFSNTFGAGGITKLFARSKLVASQWLLMHPAWALAQVWANMSLVTIGQPQTWVTRGFRDWIGHKNSADRQRFLEFGGTPTHHVDYDLSGHSYIASLYGIKHAREALANSPTYIKTFQGRKTPKDWFFGFDIRQTTYFVNRALHSKLKGEALRRMEGKANRIMLILDDALEAAGKKQKSKRQKDLDKAMSDVLADTKTMTRLSDEVHSFMGDYLTFTPRERQVLANNVLFYGFMRHSLMLSLWTLPVKHPNRLALIEQMGHLVERDQYEQYLEESRTFKAKMYASELMNTGRYTEKEALQIGESMAAKWEPEGRSLPFNMWGNWMIPGSDEVISLRRASFIGSSPIEAVGQGKAWQPLAGFSPLAGGIMEMTSGVDMYSGYPIITQPDQQPRPGFNPLAPADMPAVGLTSLLGYFAPARYASQASSKLPPYQRTGTSFPLPGPINPFPEVPLKHSTKEDFYARDLQRLASRIYQEANSPGDVLRSELFYPGHDDDLIEVGAYFDLKKQLEVSGHINAVRDEEQAAKKKKLERKGKLEQGYGLPDRMSESSSTAYGLDARGGVTDEGYDISTPAPEPDKRRLGHEIAEIARRIYNIDTAPDGGGKRAQKRGGRPTGQRPELAGAQPPGFNWLGALSAGIDVLQGQAPGGASIRPDKVDKTPRQPTPYGLTAKKNVKRRLKAAVARVGGVPEGVPERFEAAVAKYGKLVDPVAPEGMTGAEYLAGILHFESGFNTDIGTPENTSSAGAMGAGQFMPGTAATFQSEYKVDPYGDLDSQVKASAMHLSGKFGHAPLYAGYNPGFGSDPIPDAAASLGPTEPVRPIPKRLRRRAEKVLGKKQVKQIMEGPDEPYQLQTQELFHDPAGAVNLADGGQPSAPIGNHDTHVHYASTDMKSMLIVAKIVQKHGGNLTENPAVGSVDPTVHSQTGFHYKTIPGKAKGKLSRKTGLKGETLGTAWDITAPGNDPAILMAINKEIAARTGAAGAAGATIGAASASGSSAMTGVMPDQSGMASPDSGRLPRDARGNAIKYRFFDEKEQARAREELERQTAASGVTVDELPGYDLGKVPAPEEDIAEQYGF